MQLIGVQYFSMKDLLASKLGLVRKTLHNPYNQTMNARICESGYNSQMVVRLEEIEQTNDMINLTFKACEFDEMGALIYKLYRNRSLGEFVEVYKSERRRNNPEIGCQWKEMTIPVKDLARNDIERVLKLEVYRTKKGRENVYLGECEFSILGLKTSKKNKFNCYKKKALTGIIELVDLTEWNKYSFLDYIYGGLTVSLYLAIDMTKANKDLHLYNPDHALEDSSSEEDFGPLSKSKSRSKIKRKKDKDKASRAEQKSLANLRTEKIAEKDK